MKSIVIFAGAGASRGVSAKKYPMALDFKKRLPEGVLKNPLYVALDKFLAQHNSDGADIEHVLWELAILAQASEYLTRVGGFGHFVLQQNLLQKLSGSGQSGGDSITQHSNFNRQVGALKDQINSCVYDFYSLEPTMEELMGSWFPLLNLISSLGFESVDIVTTNYDVVLESVMDGLPDAPFKLPATSGRFSSLDVDAWRGAECAGLLTKLHGSVDWKLGNGGSALRPVIRVGHPEFDGDHGKRLILYPGFKGAPDSEPFGVFHDYFRRTARRVTHILFIGFAFRDEYINNILSMTIPGTAKVAVVNPVEHLPSLPFLQNALHLKQGFGLPENGSLLSSGGIVPFSLREVGAWLD